MKLKLVFLMVFLFIALFSVLIFTQGLGGRDSKIKKIPFVYDKNDFGEIKIRYEQMVGAEDESVKSGFPIDLPAHTCFDLEIKRPLPALEKGGRYFFPAYSFVCFVPISGVNEKNFAKSYPNFNGAVMKLRKLLQDKPKDLKQSFEEREGIFDVPYNNAGWSFVSKIQYLDYRNLSGVFFLTQYSQDVTPNPANNEELTANFQGLTKDEKFYVAARFSVTHASLPKGIDFTDDKIQSEALLGESAEEITRRVKEYLLKEKEKVEKLPEETFQPSITEVKKLIASIEIK